MAQSGGCGGGNHGTEQTVTKLSTKELAADLSEILERVRGGERFVIECDGAALAVLTSPLVVPAVTGRELAEALRNVPRPDDRFADDLKAIHTAQGLSGRSA